MSSNQSRSAAFIGVVREPEARWHFQGQAFDRACAGCKLASVFTATAFDNLFGAVNFSKAQRMRCPQVLEVEE